MDVELNVSRVTPPVYLHIGDEAREVGSAGVFAHVSPCDGQVDGEIPLAGPAEIDEAVEVAHAAFEGWRHASPAERRRVLSRLAELIEEHADEFARRGTLDNGTAISARPASNAAEWFRYYAGWTDKLNGETVASYATQGEFGYTLAQPYGVIGIIITWNAPLGSLAAKLPAALAAGNTVVVKPSELTPFSSELLADLVAEAGFPDGVVNILPGDASAGEALVKHPLVKKVSFTGGPVTATKILLACAAQSKPAVMELGGKSANIIFEDTDLRTAAVEGATRVLGVMSGQGCAFPTRMLVERSVYEEVIDQVRVVAENVEVGDPFEPTTRMGPVVSEAALTRILGLVDRAKRDGARLVTGGSRIGGALADGFYVEPTVFADVDPMSELAQTEVFGPVLAIMPFDTEQQALEIANGTEYGLSGYIWTSNLSRAVRVAEELVAGDIRINGFDRSVSRPFGGFGTSGMGKEGGREGIAEYLRIKAVNLC